MAVTNTYETFEGRTGSDDNKYQVALSRTFIVQTNDVTDHVPDLFTYINLPWIYSQHPNFEFAYCVSRSATQMEDPFFWKVTCNYSSTLTANSPEIASQNKGSSPEEKAEEANVNPLNRPTDIDFSTVDKEYVMTEDFSTPVKPLINGNGERFDPPVMGSRPLLAMKLEFNSATFIALDWMDRVKCVNTNSFSGFGPRTMLLDKVTAKRVYENGTKYWRISLEYLLNKENWDAEILNHSYTEWNGTKLIAAKDIAGNALPNGVIIMGDTGIPLDHGVAPSLANGGFLEFRLYDDIPYTYLTPIYRKIL